MLIRKGKAGNLEDNTVRKYRPICLLDVLGKILEGLILGRLQQELEAKGEVSTRQYGIRKGLSTLHPMQKIIDMVKKIKRKATKNREFCILITLDIKNVFNMPKCAGIINELKRKDISPYLINIIASYLSSRKLTLSTSNKQDIYCGVLQGSILGTTLWNAYFDDIANTRLPPGADILCYADDTALTATGKTLEDIRNKAEMSFNRIHREIEKKLQVAVKMTEMVILYGVRGLKNISIDFRGKEMRSKDKIKCTGGVF